MIHGINSGREVDVIKQIYPFFDLALRFSVTLTSQVEGRKIQRFLSMVFITHSRTLVMKKQKEDESSKPVMCLPLCYLISISQ